MWQKWKGKYHFLITVRGVAKEGQFLQTYCQELVQVRKKNQVPYPLERKCGNCSGVSALINTSVEEAKRYSLPRESRLVVLYRALELTQSVTLKKAIESRIRKVAGVSDSGSQKAKAS